METIQLPYPVPYFAQVASPDLAGRIFDESLPAGQDPRWAESGARTPAEYAYWAGRACGAACVRMCVEALGGRERGLVEWARDGAALGGYRIIEGANGQREEIGWVHTTLAALLQQEGLRAEARPARLDEMPEFVQAGKLVIASVSYEIGTHKPVTRRGGHLVVVTGAEVEPGRVAALWVHNPSGRTPELRIHARIPRERFEAGYTGRVITVWKEAA